MKLSVMRRASIRIESTLRGGVCGGRVKRVKVRRRVFFIGKAGRTCCWSAGQGRKTLACLETETPRCLAAASSFFAVAVTV